jgi:hypothetical protein
MQLNEINKSEKSVFKVQGERETQIMTFSVFLRKVNVNLKKIFKLVHHADDHALVGKHI